jgi:hypothetical protein
VIATTRLEAIARRFSRTIARARTRHGFVDILLRVFAAPYTSDPKLGLLLESANGTAASSGGYGERQLTVKEILRTPTQKPYLRESHYG